MGTLGCINDMLRRDRENRELRKHSRERMQETRKKLLDTRKMQANLQLSAEKIDGIRGKIVEKEEHDKNQAFKVKVEMVVLCLCLFLLLYLVFSLF